jgi:hypothetical protein
MALSIIYKSEAKNGFRTTNTVWGIKMDVHSMSFQELKIVAKNHRPRIKQYYIKSRLELIQLLTMNQLPQSYIIEKKTIQELRSEAKAKGFAGGIWKMNRADLVGLLYPGPNQNDQDNDGGQKHDYPQKGEGN